MRSSLNVRIEAIPMYYRGSIRKIKVHSSTNGELMLGYIHDANEMDAVKEYIRKMAVRRMKHGARIKVIWPFN
jgi:hypothetical protein